MTEQQIIIEFKELESDSNFISEKVEEFSQRYAKKFIAVKDRQVVAVGDNFEMLIEEVKQRGFNPARVLIQYIPAKDEIILY